MYFEEIYNIKSKTLIKITQEQVFSCVCSSTYLEPSQRSKMVLSTKKVYGFKWLSSFAKSFNFNVWLGSECATDVEKL